MMRAFVQGVYHTLNNPEDVIPVMMKHLRRERETALDAYQPNNKIAHTLAHRKGVELMAQ